MKRPSLLLAAGALAFLVYAYPGLFTLDSTDQLAEGRAGFYTDAHPPLMGMLWGVLDRVVAGPFLMLLLQAGTFLAGSYLVLRRLLSPTAAAVAASLLLLFPPILTPMAFIWKDSLMAGLLLLGTGLVVSADRRARLGALACFALATGVKYNAFVATLPLVVLLFEWSPGQRALRRYGLAVATWLVITAGTMGLSGALVDQKMYFWHSSLAVADIAGVLTYENDVPDAQVERDLAGTQLLVHEHIQDHARRVYATGDMMKLVVGDDRMWDLPIMGKVPAPEAQRDAIAAAWSRLVFGHPFAYLAHRMDTFADVIGLTYKTYSAVPPRIMKYPGFLTQLGLSTHSYGFQNAWTNMHKALWRHTPLFRPYLYIALALVLLWFARKQRLLLALLASGLLAEASLIALAPSPDYRYSHWTIVCACYALVTIAWQRVVAARGTAGTPAASTRA